MNENVFGYLLVPQQSLSDYAVIAKDYWLSTVEMNEQNRRYNENYSCCVVCVNCSWWQRQKLSFRTGIPMKRICNVCAVRERYPKKDFVMIITADSMVDDTFFGRTKVYASEKDIPRQDLGIELVYAQ